MTKTITLKIDDKQLTVPAGTLIVDAAKKVGIDIPVFCYHPKMEPVGMCRMCLVEIGRPVIDRSTREVVLNEDGTPKIQFGPKLETGCTTPVSEGMIVLTHSEAAAAAHKEVVEFLLTSHPLDCPVCDKGGECPLQNQTMGFGPGQSRFMFSEKQHLAKRVPLGELIFLDRERCIQCGRCVRFQDEIVDEPVLNFSERGRKMQIVTASEPGFDSIFSGNTTDICPVGALTTADFRFGARPWELTPAASICTQCPVGCNITFNVRREAKAGGDPVIKRVMPRQNEQVNELWICDKGRFAYQYTESNERLSEPLARKDNKLVPVSWKEALDLAAAKLKDAHNPAVLAGGRLSNEDLYNLHALADGSQAKALLYSCMAGGDLTAVYGLGAGSNFSDMGKGSAILVVASDLHEEAPLYWLRIKQAAQRGATLIVLNPRATRLDKYAAFTLRYAYGEEAGALNAFLPGAEAAEEYRAAIEAFRAAEDALVVYGSEGLGLEGSQALAQTAAALVASHGKVGQANNGLLAVWDRANVQGAWDTGFRPAVDLAEQLGSADVLLIAAADPAGDDPALLELVNRAGFVIVQELFLTETAQRADLVLPVMAFTEREGSLTSAERRVQRYYPALSPRPGAQADYAIAAQIGQRLGLNIEGRAPSLVLLKLAEAIKPYAGLSYQRLSETSEQWPIVGRADLYYGGTAYDNHQGLGIPLPLAQNESTPQAAPDAKLPAVDKDSLLLVPVTRLYDRGTTVMPSTLLHQRLAQTAVWMGAQTAERLGLNSSQRIELSAEGWKAQAGLIILEGLPEGVGLVPRSVGIPVVNPVAVTIRQLAPEPEA